MPVCEFAAFRPLTGQPFAEPDAALHIIYGDVYVAVAPFILNQTLKIALPRAVRRRVIGIDGVNAYIFCRLAEHFGSEPAEFFDGLEVAAKDNILAVPLYMAGEDFIESLGVLQSATECLEVSFRLLPSGENDISNILLDGLFRLSLYHTALK